MARPSVGERRNEDGLLRSSSPVRSHLTPIFLLSFRSPGRSMNADVRSRSGGGEP
jgi:hypothetical protein